MRKDHALKLLGSTNVEVAEAIGITPSAVSQWPDNLPDRIADRVVAAWARKQFPEQLHAASTCLADASPSMTASVAGQPGTVHNNGMAVQ